MPLQDEDSDQEMELDDERELSWSEMPREATPPAHSALAVLAAQRGMPCNW